jgi:uncharacterized protein (DUF2336 family)
MYESQSLIGELEAAMQSGSNDQRTTTLRRVTDLFIDQAERYDGQQIQLFDDVLGHMVKRIESKALSELSGRLAPIAKAPTALMRRLASDKDISIAGPVLTRSSRLTSHDLTDIAREAGHDHALAISGRARLEEQVTDELLQKGYREVDRRLAGNVRAQFSDNGFSTLAQRAEDDEVLAERVCARHDFSPRLVRQLVTRATEDVRARLLASADPHNRARIREVLTNVSNQTDSEMSRRSKYGEAERLVLEMQKQGQLNETALMEFAKTKRFAETVCAMAILSTGPVELFERLLTSKDTGALLIPCKAAGFDWSTVGAILRARPPGFALQDHDIARIKADYHQLTKATAERVQRFWQVRDTAARTAKSGGPAEPARPAGQRQ